MRAERIKQVLKNSVYRTIGETAAVVGAKRRRGPHPPRAHVPQGQRPARQPVDDPVSLFDEQMDQLQQLGYQVVDLDAVLAHYVDGTPYRLAPPDHLRRRLPRQPRERARVLQKYGYSAVLFVPLGYLGDRHPLPHEEHLAARGHPQPHGRLGRAGRGRAPGVRIESHGISHRPLADLEVDEAAREIALSKFRLEQRLGRPVRAFAYAKGSEAHYKPVHLSLVRQAGYDVAFTAVSGANFPSTDRCSCAATTSSRTRRGRSSSCSPAPAT